MSELNIEMRSQLETNRRNKLKLEKPKAYNKIIHYIEMEKRGLPTPVIDFSYDYICNMHCAHCSNACFLPKNRSLSLEDIVSLSEQADELGLAQFSLSGGEPTVFPQLDDIIAAIGPSKFHIALNTNGILLTEDRAAHLKKIGIDKVKISLDSFDEQVYNQTRQQDGAYDKALRAIDACAKAGIQVSIQTVVSHQTCQSQTTEKLAQFAHERQMSLDIIAAKAVGRWEGKEEVLLTPEDDEFLLRLRNQYPEVHRDVFPTYGRCGGCIAVKCVIHITKYGDVLPCPFMHISIGNIFEESLKEILDRGMSLKWFHTYHPTCLSGENRYFIRNYMSKFYGKPLPIDWREAFTQEDFIIGC